MIERIKEALVDQMMNIHGEKTEGWWYEPDTLNEVAAAVMKAAIDEE